jgi:iron complex transport system substrate-binding protein
MRWPLRRVLPVLLAAASVGACQRTDPEPVRVADPQRVIALAPSLVEMLFELELGDRVVGVGDYCTWPEEAVAKPKIGGLFNPDVEQIARLDPELAVLLPSEEQLKLQLERLGVEVLVVPSESLADIEAAATTLSSRFGVLERGEEFVGRWREALAPTTLGGSPRVLLAVARQRGTLAETLSAGPGTFYHELLDRLGATNLFHDAAALYPQVSLEEAMQRLPEAIIDIQPERPSEYVRGRLRADWDVLGGVPALERDCYAVIGGDYAMLPGPRLPQLYQELREALERCGF